MVMGVGMQACRKVWKELVIECRLGNRAFRSSVNDVLVVVFLTYFGSLSLSFCYSTKYPSFLHCTIFLALLLHQFSLPGSSIAR